VLGDGDKEAGTYGLDYDGILALTVKALQEANIKTKQLENKIEQLENRISQLENK
jgi:phage shock protein A